MADNFDLEVYLGELRQLVDGALREYLQQASGQDPLQLRRAMREAVINGGKRLRPCLTLAACEAVGGRLEDGLASACAVEMIHAYSLIHDDLPAMDDDDLRRGHPTLHKRYGEAAAILAGDALLTKAFEVLAHPAPNSPEMVFGRVKAVSELARAAGASGMVGGQALDMQLKEDAPDFQTLESCHRQKTAALFGASAALGALAGAAADDEVNGMREYGLTLGLAFQHADDLRDAEFAHYRVMSMARAEELCQRAAELAGRFTRKAAPLRALAALVCRRATETGKK